MDGNSKKAVFTVIERNDGENKRSFWVRIGAAFVNRDGSYTLRLDALPVNGMLQVRDERPREEWPRRDAANANANANGGGRTHADIFAGGA